MVSADRPRSVAQLGLQGHQGPVADFLERSEADPAPRCVGGHERGGQLAAQSTHQVTQLDTLLGLLVPQLEQPVVVDPGQQVAAVRLQRGRGLRQPDGRIGVGGRQGGASGLFEEPDIDAAGLRVAPAEVSGGDLQRAGVLDDPAQVVQFTAQIGQGLGVGGIGPQGSGHPLPGLRPAGVHHQQGQQRQRLRRARTDAPFASSVITCCPSRKIFSIWTALLRKPR